MVKYDKVTVHFVGETEPMVVERVSGLAKTHFPESENPALQIIDVPPGPSAGGSLFDLKLNLAAPSKIDHLVLQEGEEERTAEVEELFPEWDWQSSEPELMPDTLRLRVTEVTDGDTIEAQARNGDTVTVRVWGIDAPELSQPYGPAATDVARTLVGGEVADIDVIDWDRYGRIVGRVQTDGTDLAASLALSGYAWHSRRYPTSRQIREAEQKARQEGRGLWAQDDPVPPWKHRQGRQPAQTGNDGHTAGTVLFIVLFIVIVVVVLALISLAGG